MKSLAVMFVVLAGIVGLMGRATFLTASAQDATPVAVSLAPSPEECTVEPITVERLAAVMGGDASASPEATPALPEVETEVTPVASPSVFTMPEGTPVDEATAAAISAAVRVYMACINAGDYARLLSLYSDSGLRQLLGNVIGQGFTAEDVVSSFGTPQPLPDDQTTLLFGIDTILALPDGRVAALVIGDDQSNPGPPGPALIYFVQVDGEWLVDGFIRTEEIVGS